MPLPFSTEALLDAIPGVAYVVDREGVILAFSRGPFMEDVRLPAASGYGHTIGSSLFSIVQGEQVQRSYRSMHEAACRGQFNTFGFAYRCDAPNVERNMFMSISRIVEGSEAVAVLYQSIIVSELYRAPLPLFRFEALAERAAPSDHVVTLCSYCQKVAWQVAEAGHAEWIEAVEFYRRGGPTDAAVTHGICETCFEQIVQRATQGNQTG
jgi:hypothetical protein